MPLTIEQVEQGRAVALKARKSCRIYAPVDLVEWGREHGFVSGPRPAPPEDPLAYQRTEQYRAERRAYYYANRDKIRAQQNAKRRRQ